MTPAEGKSRWRGGCRGAEQGGAGDSAVGSRCDKKTPPVARRRSWESGV